MSRHIKYGQLSSSLLGNTHICLTHLLLYMDERIMKITMEMQISNTNEQEIANHESNGLKKPILLRYGIMMN